jgi:membrane protein YdbS with pleckstrin-like domain
MFDSMPEPMDYHSQKPTSNWPAGWYITALVWAFLTLTVASAMTTAYREENAANTRTQFPLLLCAAGQLVWARYRGERSKSWIFYIAVLVAAVPIWYLVAPPIASVARSILGRPLIP